jgi:Zn-dependent membrane protease YugP
MLNTNGLSHVAIAEVSGELNDHYDPRTNVVSLSTAVYHGRTVSAVAIACHECGHAVQHARSYTPARVRGAIVPAVNIAANVWVLALLAGIFLSIIGLVYLAVLLFLAVLIFQLVTLPVEFNASSRGLAFLNNSGWLTAREQGGAKAVLRSAAMTYVAAALASILQLLYLLGMSRR